MNPLHMIGAIVLTAVAASLTTLAVADSPPVEEVPTINMLCYLICEQPIIEMVPVPDEYVDPNMPKHTF